MAKEYIEREAAVSLLLRERHTYRHTQEICAVANCAVAIKESVPAADVIEVRQIKDYLQSKLDEWFALGDRRFEPANMWGYNFIMACFDDLAKMDGKGEGE